jgi:hypothetical protein
LIAQGLAAAAVLGEVDDTRDLTFFLAALHHSAIKLGLDARRLFADATALAISDLLRHEMQGFPLRLPHDADSAVSICAR